VILLKKQREKIGRFLLKKKLEKVNRKIEMQKLNEINKAGIFFDAASEQCRKSVKTFIKGLSAKNINVWSLGYFDTKNPENSFISDKFLYFSTLKDFSFFFLPKTEEVKEFITRPVDILFVFSEKDPLPATAVVKSSVAKLKVGITGKFDNALDLTFEIEGKKPENLIEQIERYL
jgi:hypothetical protein